jgi:hypothetical protein
MYHPEQFNIAILETPSTPSPSPVRSACLVHGCTCKDAWIVSPRRVAFFAAIARQTGETADRTVPADPAWSFNWVVPAADEMSLAVAA